jgi:hypothetical protein
MMRVAHKQHHLITTSEQDMDTTTSAGEITQHSIKSYAVNLY